ncbi:E3 ubiquitin-protein ligase TOM1 SCDLUD_004925 [Saccharomycodes ludwigii]|uniref:E3 ubiquitin-protein ligase TOM1 n=1 Tax=Saccharomycodes ludwigii TaxID=36035 RepID=UPI001E88C3CF|nr:hypothetical protein SCDLUD_004925 [Saccharomycodes ludwigii]KAH3899481.1 hypothetical protein SCDLUD_004925 [Saccharomycodes ludwigii]
MIVIAPCKQLQKEERAKPFKPLMDKLTKNCSEEDFLHAISQIQEWDRSRDDLYVWIPVLDRMDEILKKIVEKYHYKPTINESDNTESPVKLIVMNQEDENIVVTITAFTARLLYNSTGVSVYSSLDRMWCLINSPNFKVKIGAMEIMALMAERHSLLGEKIPNTSPLADNNLKEKAKMLILSLPSSAMDDSSNHFSLVDLFFDEKKYPSSWDNLKFMYYTPKNVMKFFKLNKEQLKSLTLQQIFDKGMCEIPADRWFEFSVKSTIAKAFSDDSFENKELRNSAIRVKLNSLAYINIVLPPPKVSSTVFEIDTYIFECLNEFIMLSETKLPRSIRSDAVFALECISLSKIWCSDIVKNLGGNMPHGILFQALKYIAKIMRENKVDEVDENYNVRFFYLISNIAGMNSLHDTLVSSGLISSLLEIISIPNCKFYRTMASASHLLKIILWDFETATQFYNDNGFNILIQCITNEVKFAIEHPEFGKPSPYVKVYYSFSFRQLSFMRALLKLVRTVLSCDSSDRIRNLIDSPILPALNKIIENRSIFGYTLVADALEVIQDMINSEPTIYPILVESQTISTIFNNFDNFLGPCGSLLKTLPTLISAICLNVNGLKEVKERKLVSKLFEVVKNVEFAKIIVWEEHDYHYGNELDELARHYPDLKPELEAGFIQTIKDVSRQISFSQPSIYTSTKTGCTDIFYKSESTEVIDMEEGAKTMEVFEIQDSSFVLSVLTALISACSWPALVEELEPKDIYSLISVNNMPFDFINSNACMEFVDFIISLNDQKNTFGFEELIETVAAKLTEIGTFLTYSNSKSFILNNSYETVKDLFEKVNTICGLLNVLGRVYMNYPSLYSSRIAILFKFVKEGSFDLLDNLFKLFEKCSLEEFYIREKLPTKVCEETTPQSSTRYPPLVIHKGTKLLDLKFYSKKNSAKFKNTFQIRFVLNKIQYEIAEMLRSLVKLSSTKVFTFDKEHKTWEIKLRGMVVQNISNLLDFGTLPIEKYYSHYLVLLHFFNDILTLPYGGNSIEHLQIVSISLFYKYKVHEKYLYIIENILSLLPAIDFEFSPDIGKIKYIKDDKNILFLLFKFSTNFLSRTIDSKYLEESHSVTSYFFDEDAEMQRMQGHIPTCFRDNVKSVLLSHYRNLLTENLWLLSTKKLSTIFADELIVFFAAFFKYTKFPEREPERVPLAYVSWDKQKPSYVKVSLLEKYGVSHEAAVDYLIKYQDKLPREKIDLIADWDGYSKELLSADVSSSFKPDYMVSEADLQSFETRVGDFKKCVSLKLIIDMFVSYPDAARSIYSLLLEINEDDRDILLENILKNIEQNLEKNNSACIGPSFSLFGNVLKRMPLSTYPHIKVLDKACHIISDYLSTECAQESFFSELLFAYETIFAANQIPEAESVLNDVVVPFNSNITKIHVPKEISSKIYECLIKVREVTNIKSAISITRVLVLYAKDYNLAKQIAKSGVLSCLLKCIGVNQKNEMLAMLEGPFLVLLRFCFETREIVKDVISYEIEKAFTTRAIGDESEKQRNLSTLLLEKANLVLRDPDVFVDVLSKDARFESFNGQNELETPMVRRYIDPSTEESNKKTQDNSNFGIAYRTGIVHLLFAQLMAASKKDWLSEPPLNEEEKSKLAKSKKSNTSFKNPVWLYMVFLLQVLIELVGSYKQAKFELLTFSKRNIYSNSTKPRPTFINFLLFDLLSLPKKDNIEAKRSLINDLVSTLLCAFLSSPPVVKKLKDNKPSFKYVDADIVFIQKFSLECILKALNGVSESNKSILENISKIHIWFKLIEIVLTSKKANLMDVIGHVMYTSDRCSLCKIMLDLDLPNVITSSIANLDMNYPPAVKLFNVSIQSLNAISSIRENNVDLFDIGNNEEDVEEDVESEKEEDTNMFKNSALGMYDVEDIEDEEDDDNDIIGDDDSLLGDDDNDEIAFVDEDQDMEVVFSDGEGDDEEGERERERERERDRSNVTSHFENIDDYGVSDSDIEIEVIRDEDLEDGESDTNDEQEERDSDNMSIDIEEEEEMLDFYNSIEDQSDWDSGISDFSDSEIDADDEHHAPLFEDGNFDQDGYESQIESDMEPVFEIHEPEDATGNIMDRWRSFGGNVARVSQVRTTHFNDTPSTHPRSHLNRRRHSRNSQHHMDSHDISTHFIYLRDRNMGDIANSLSNIFGGPFQNEGTLGGDGFLHEFMTPLDFEVFTNQSRSPDQPLVLGSRRARGFRARTFDFTTSNIITDFRFNIELSSTSVRWDDVYSMFYSSKLFSYNVIPAIVNRIFNVSLKLHLKKKEEEMELKRKMQERLEELKRIQAARKRKFTELDEEAEENYIDSSSDEHTDPVYVDIGGQPVDVSRTDIDPEYLRALPEELREEVFYEHVAASRLRRLSQRGTNPQPIRRGSEVTPEFFSSLPEDIREQIIERESRLHDENVFEEDEDDNEPENVAAREQIQEILTNQERLADSDNAGGALLDRINSLVNHISSTSNPITNHNTGNHTTNSHSSNKQKKKARNHFSPLLDRSGIAVVLKSIFIPQAYIKRDDHHVLYQSLCYSKQNRSDLLNFILLILADGINSQSNLEKIYNFICRRTSPSTPKTVQFSLNINCSPLLVASQCIEALQYLVDCVGSVKLFFIAEHESLLVNKFPFKSKKDICTSNPKWPINYLFVLLTKKIITDESVLMDLVTNILQFCTKTIKSLMKSKKSNVLVPHIDASSYNSIVNVLKLDSCSTKVFQQTLTTMKNLCCIKGAKQDFIESLQFIASISVTKLIEGLDQLAKELPKVKEGNEINSEIIQQFLSPSSEQSKLLKVLTSIDYLSTSNIDSGDDTAHKNDKDEVVEDEKVSSLLKIYDGMELGNLWSALSRTLTQFENHKELTTSAAMLLPLIESLMVVCKHSKVSKSKELQFSDKDTFQVDFAKEPVANLFFLFTDSHKKLLNEMIRSNSKLMSGPFALLVKNSKVLDFDNKRFYFMGKIEAESKDRQKLSIKVSREQVFMDSYRALFFKPVQEMKNCKLEVTFKDEQGVDAGGVKREWYQILSRQMVNPDYALFTPVPSDKNTFHPNRTSGINPEHLSFFKFIGMVIGKAIRDKCYVDCHFSRDVYKGLLDKPVSLKDMESVDPDYYKSLVWILENDITDVIEETFSVETDDYGEHNIIDLKPNGHNIAVTEENKNEYVQKILSYKLQTSVQDQMNNFLFGFYSMVPKELITIFNEQEVELLMSGLPDIDINDWKSNTVYVNYTPSCKQINYFWRAVKSFDKEERAKLLQFVTGTSKVPLNGFKELAGVNGVSKFSIHKDYGATDRLPSSHTCFNQLDLPAYDSYETLRKALLLAINEGHQGFGIA